MMGSFGLWVLGVGSDFQMLAAMPYMQFFKIFNQKLFLVSVWKMTVHPFSS